MPDHSYRSRGRKRWLTLFLLASVVLVYFLPTLALQSPLRQTVLDLVAEQLNGSIECDRLAIGWFTPLSATEARLLDEDGEAVVTAAKIESSATLLNLIFEPTNPGAIALHEAELQLRVRAGGSNLEDVLAPLLKPSDDPTQAARFQINVIDSEIVLRNQDGAKLGHVQKIESEWTVDTEANEIAWTVEAETGGALPEGGKFECKGEWDLSRKREGSMSWDAEAVPLQLANAVLLRFNQSLEPAGAVASSGDVRWDFQGAEIRLHRLNISELDLGPPSLFQGDRLRSQRVTARGELFVGPKDWRCRRLELGADWLECHLDGELQPEPFLAALRAQDWDAAAVAIRGEARGWVDLAMLSHSLPHAMRIREDTLIREGGVNFRLVDAQTMPVGRRRFLLSLDTQPLQAVTAGRVVEWRDPMTLQASLLRGPEGWSIEEVRCESEFLTITGSGPPERGEINLNGDLNQLRQRLEQFVDLRGVRFGGDLEGKGQWQREGDRVRFNGRIAIEDFQLSTGAGLWREPKAVATAAGDLREQEGHWTIERWQAEVLAQQDRLSVQPDDGNGYRVEAAGKIDRWLEIAGLVMDLGANRVRGDFRCTATVVPSTDSLRIAKSEWSVRQFELATPYTAEAIRQAEVSGTLRGEYDRRQTRWTTDHATLQSAALSAATNRCEIQMGAQPAMDGAFSVRGDLKTLSNWFADQTGVHLRGEVVSKFSLASNGRQGQASWQLDAEDFQWLSQPPASRVATVSRRPPELVWQERQLTTKGDAAFDLEAKQIEFKDLQCALPWLAISANGRVRPWESGCPANVVGSLTYDWPTLMKKLASESASTVVVYGRQTESFEIQGPLLASSAQGDQAPAFPSPSLTAKASLGWDRAEAYGFELGSASLRSQLASRIIAFDPIEMRVNDGRARLRPQIDLQQSPAILTLAPGDGLEKVDLTPEMCHGWLKYVAPLLADATRAQGRLSLEVKDARVPLGRLASTQSRGVLKLHAGKVGPGSLAAELLQPLQHLLSLADPRAAQQLSANSWLEIPEQDVPFEVRRGRVHHHGLKLQIGDALVQTSGSVGLDQTLDLQVAIPVRDAWVASSRYLAPLRGKTIPLRIHGSLGKPNVDEGALRKLGNESLRGAAEQLLQDQLQRGLKKLFQP